jgi:hypothetical protein
MTMGPDPPRDGRYMNRSASRSGQGPVGNIHGLNVDLAPTAGEHLYYREFARKVHAFRTDDLLPELAKVALMQEPPYSPEYRRIFPAMGTSSPREGVLARREDEEGHARRSASGAPTL